MDHLENTEIIDVEVSEENEVDVYAEEFVTYKLPEVRRMTRGQRKAMIAAGFDLDRFAIKLAQLQGKKMSDLTEQEVDLFSKQHEGFDWILDNVYPEKEIDWDSIPDDVGQAFAQRTYIKSKGNSAAVKN